jgi:hypothetical protein
MHSGRVISVVLVALGAGCAPLQQAPLVYSSSVVLGATIGATPQDNYAPNMTVGFKSLDAAYVPVTVSRDCSAAVAALLDMKRADVTDKAYEVLAEICVISPVIGTNDATKEVSATDAGAEMKRVEFNKLLTELQALYEQQRDISSDIAKLERERDAVLADQKKTKACPAGGAVPDEEEDQDAGEEVEEEAAAPVAEGTDCTPTDAYAILSSKWSEQLEYIKERLPEQNKALATVTASINAKLPDLSNFIAKASNQTIDVITGANQGDKKSDAYSVYGTFDGATGASSPTGGTPKDASHGESHQVRLDVGKVFSTGVASQHITQGLNSILVANAAVTCIVVANRLRQEETERWLKMDAAAQGADKAAYKKNLDEAFTSNMAACNAVKVTAVSK